MMRPTDYVVYPARPQVANYILLVLPWCHPMKPSAFAKAYSPECVEGVFYKLPLYGVLRSSLRGSAGGIILVVDGEIPL
jgi:hypothetical protein